MGKIIPLKRHKSPEKRPFWRRFSFVIVALPIAAFSAAFFWGGGPEIRAADSAPNNGQASQDDTQSGDFSICSGSRRITCIVDGDTFWFEGEKIRIADINTPEVTSPKCSAEAELGAQATDRLQQLMNAGRFTLTGTATDRYGRALRTVMRGRQSLGEVLVDEGLAEKWRGYKRDWC